MQKTAMAIHGGAGDLPLGGMDRVLEKSYMDSLKSILHKAYAVLKTGGSALDAVETAVILLENDPLYNSGKGASMNFNHEFQMDAAITCGKTLESGSVSNLTSIKNPIQLARKIMENCPHNFLIGKGAEEFAKKNGIFFESYDYFHTAGREELWKSFHEKEIIPGLYEGGTAGAVALDADGNLAAATSTGGLTNGLPGRLTDASVIGAGTYANNESCAVSCSGTGEFVLKHLASHEISALIKYKHDSVNEACKEILAKISHDKAMFGVIAIDQKGQIANCFNTQRMFRAWIDTSGQETVLLY